MNHTTCWISNRNSAQNRNRTCTPCGTRTWNVRVYQFRHLGMYLNLKIWSGKRDSNSRPQPWQGCALPTELFPHYIPCYKNKLWRGGDSNSHASRHYHLKVARLPFRHLSIMDVNIYWGWLHQQTTDIRVPRTGLEPARLAAHAPETCASTNSATWARSILIWAENETRTRDPNLGKVVLYQLSYFRILERYLCQRSLWRNSLQYFNVRCATSLFAVAKVHLFLNTANKTESFLWTSYDFSRLCLRLPIYIMCICFPPRIRSAGMFHSRLT